MTCQSWIRVSYMVEDEHGSLYEVSQMRLDRSLWRRALLRVEAFITYIVSAKGRRSWVLNGLLHSRHVYPVWTRIWQTMLYPRGDGWFVGTVEK